MTTTLNTKTILVCDDEDDILDMMAHALKRAGYAVSTAHEHREFMERFHEQKPDLIILDLYMPEHDGFWIAEHLPCRQRIPIIFITAHDRPLYRLCAPIVGAEDYIAKPFDLDVLLTRIERALNLKSRPSSTRFLEAIGEGGSHDRFNHQRAQGTPREIQ
jgi:DNA-binding response OmpR family regulator